MTIWAGFSIGIVSAEFVLAGVTTMGEAAVLGVSEGVESGEGAGDAESGVMAVSAIDVVSGAEAGGGDVGDEAGRGESGAVSISVILVRRRKCISSISNFVLLCSRKSQVTDDEEQEDGMRNNTARKKLSEKETKG